MKKPALLGCAAALIAGSALAASHPGLVAHKQAQRFISGAPPGSTTLHDQNGDPAGTAVVSDNLAGSQAADDFVVPKGHRWMIQEIDVTGVYFNGSGPADSENVFFYSDNGGVPGDLLVACSNQNGTDGGFGSFAIRLTKPCKVNLKGKTSQGTTYWVSVQANVDFFGGAGDWGWDQTSDINGNLAVWANGDGWTRLDSDLMFALKGKDKS